MKNSTLLRYTTVNQRNEMFNNAYNIAYIEFGELSERAKEIIDEYIYGKDELNKIETKILELYKKEKVINKNNLFDNLLNITEESELKFASVAIVTIKLMKIDNDIFNFNYEVYKQTHKEIFSLLYPWAGIERDISYWKKIDVLNNRIIEFTEYENIKESMNRIFEKINDISLMNDIDKTISDMFKGTMLLSWEDLSIEQKAALCARLTGLLWINHPFIKGNITMALYTIIRFSEDNGFRFSRGIIREQHEKINLNRCIVLASTFEEYNINFLTIIYIMANTIQINKTTNIRKRNSIDKLIESAQKEQRQRLIEDY